MAKKGKLAPVIATLTPEQKTKATAVFDGLAMAYGTGLESFRVDVFNVYCIAGVIDKDLRNELTALNRARFIEAWKGRKAKTVEASPEYAKLPDDKARASALMLTLDEVDRAKSSANATFSRYARDLEPGKAPTTRAAQTAPKTAEKADSGDAPKDDKAMPPDGPNAVPHVIQVTHHNAQVLAFLKSAQEVTAKMHESKLPAAVKAALGELGELLGKASAEASAIAAALA